MIQLETLIQFIDISLNSKRKRHIVGGALLSISFLFGSLAITAMTLRGEEESGE